jgi:hypothetical protein
MRLDQTPRSLLGSILFNALSTIAPTSWEFWKRYAQGSGGLGADGIANYWVNTTIGPGNYNGSTFCNYPNSYSKDGTHPTDLAMSIMGSIEAAAVQPLLP